jgi:hypothetical protein
MDRAYTWCAMDHSPSPTPAEQLEALRRERITTLRRRDALSEKLAEMDADIAAFERLLNRGLLGPKPEGGDAAGTEDLDARMALAHGELRNAVIQVVGSMFGEFEPDDVRLGLKVQFPSVHEKTTADSVANVLRRLADPEKGGVIVTVTPGAGKRAPKYARVAP